MPVSPLASAIVKETGCPDWIAEGIAQLPPGGAPLMARARASGRAGS